jgi:hypothetical protein
MVKALGNSLCVAAVSTAAVVLMGATSANPELVPQLTTSKGSAMIYNAGNGEFAGYRIVVSPDGQAAAVDGAGRSTNQLEGSVAQKFFNDLASAGPLDKLPAGDCASKSTAAATTVEVNAAVVISWNGQHSPALTCVTDSSAVRLLLDATTIQHALYVQAYRKRVTAGYGQSVVYGPSGVRYVRGGYGGGLAYGAGEYDGRFIFQPFKNEGFGYEQFSAGRFSFNNFDNEYPMANGVFETNLPGASPFVSLPYTSPFNGSPWTSLPQVYPFQGVQPTTNIETTSPWSGSPANGSPFVTPNLHSLP